MRLVPTSYLTFRERFPRVVRWLLDIVVFVAALFVLDIAVTVLVFALRG